MNLHEEAIKRARFSGDESALRGTAGFGFWNQPFMPNQRVPRYAWFFFGAPPHNMPFARNVRGSGWKAAIVDNQYAIITPQGALRFGILTTAQPQWLEIADLEIAPLALP